MSSMAHAELPIGRPASVAKLRTHAAEGITAVNAPPAFSISARKI
jgi:hypothetical protein